MTTQGPRARLIGRSGAFAGSSFDVEGDTMIGLDPSGQAAVGSGKVSTPFARIALRDGRYHLEVLAQQGEVRLDGAPVIGASSLDRMHVIELPEGIELVYSQSAAPPRPSEPAGGSEPRAGGHPPPPRPPEAQEPPKPPPPPQAPVPSSDVDPGKTVLDLAVFSDLPDLPKAGEPAQGPPKQDPPAQPPPAQDPPKQDPPAPDQGDGARTMLDISAFQDLPDLQGRSDTDASPPPAQDPPKEDPPKQDPPPPDPGRGDGARTMLDISAFGDLPDLQGGSDTDASPPPPSSGPPPGSVDRTVEVPRSAPRAQYCISANIPGRGPTRYDLQPGDNTIGRGEDCDITVFDMERWLSRQHAVLVVGPEGVEVIDLKGVNGTFVGGEKIDRALLRPGSTFFLGPHLEFTLEER